MRKYSSVIPDMTLAAELSAGVGSSTTTTTITLNTGAWDVVNSGDTLTLVIAPGTVNEEIVNVTAHSSNSTTATILRGLEGTSNQNTHIVGTVVRHMVTALDLQEPHTHLNNSTDVHGLVGGDVNNNTTGGAVVGNRKTQTLYNKTLDGSAGGGNNTFTNIPAAAITGLSGVYAPLASPALTGTPTVNGTAVATTATAPASHTHGNLTNDGKIGTSSGNVIVTGASGVLTALAAGSAGQFLSYNGTWATPSGGTSGVASVQGTANQVLVNSLTTAQTGAVTLSFPTGGIVAPTGSTVATSPSSGDNTTKIATTAFVTAAVSAPLWYRRTSDSTSGSAAQVMFATSPSLDASSWYYFKFFAYCIYSHSSSTPAISLTLECSSAPTSIRANSSAVSSNASSGATISSTSATSIVSVSATTNLIIEVEGFLNTNAATTFTPKISVGGGGTGNVSVGTGSHIQIQKLSSSVANINGSWS